MKTNTHLEIDQSLCGTVTKVEQGYAEVLLYTKDVMRADAEGLVHGGFVFAAADLAAMTAVNDPYVVLGASSCKFIAPVCVGDVILCKAKVSLLKGKKNIVEVSAFVKEKLIFEGTFTTFTLDAHVLKG